jgi:hypothetical protein
MDFDLDGIDGADFGFVETMEQHEKHDDLEPLTMDELIEESVPEWFRDEQ